MTAGHPFASRKGRKLRARKLQADPLCEPCRRNDRITAAVTVHHRVPLHAGGEPYPPLDGLESQCADCHLQVHGGAPRAQVDAATGLPIGRHWWSDDL